MIPAQRFKIAVVFFLCASLARAQNPADLKTGADITVRIFYAHILHAATFTPLSATLRTCADCQKKPMLSPLEVTAINGLLHVSNVPKAIPQHTLYVYGTLRVNSNDASDTSDTLHAEASGRWRITANGNELRIQLTLPSEHYIMAALAAESAPDEPLESLKALAIVIRTYALENLSRHVTEGFDLCDSTHCQALRLGAVRDSIVQAVQSTAGETLFFGAHRAQVYFTQNCGGQTESALAAWGHGEPYLQSHPDPYCARHAEAEWHASIGTTDLINVLRQNGWHPPVAITGARVVTRTTSGRAALLEFSGNGAPLRITASNLRFALDRSFGWQQVRSDWYDVSLHDGRLIFNGRGFGHGVGLCQAGAWQMAATSSDAAAILQFYFPGTSIRILPDAAVWHTQSLDGWSLQLADTQHQDAVIQAGKNAWSRARTLFPMQHVVQPQVTLSPDTEMFRQATSSAGWMLGVTVGNHIWLQPYAVCNRNGGIEKLLLHEMLHARIEQEASARAPLWLREGLVEVLADPAQKANSVTVVLPENADAAANIEAALANPTEEMQARRAHADAAALVRACIGRYGFPAVRGWLISGVPASVVVSK
jgi:stage II sporulation protein D